MIRLIKRYGGGSRKLYDTEESRYVSLDEISRWIRAGQELRVVDSATEEDVTAQTLAQIIYEDHKRGISFLPTDVLHDVIRRSGQAISARVGQLQSNVDRLVRASVDRLSPASGIQHELERLRDRLAELEASLARMEPPAAAPMPRPARKAPRRVRNRKTS